MPLFKKSFVILATLVNNILYINKPHGVKNVAVCFSNCENRTQFSLMSETTVNDGNLVVYYTQLPPNTSTYTLKLLFPDGTEGDSESFLFKHYGFNEEDIPLREDYLKKIFNLVCFIALSLLVLILKIIIKYVKRWVATRTCNIDE